MSRHIPTTGSFWCERADEKEGKRANDIMSELEIESVTKMSEWAK